jgi:hypothetical protein
MGIRGDVPKNVIEYIALRVKLFDPNTIWNCVRFLLKKNGWRTYYNRIPTIIYAIGFGPGIVWTRPEFEEFFTEFQKMHFQFDNSEQGQLLKTKYKRSYFINLRFVALKMIEERNIKTNYVIPFIRTERKAKVLNQMWVELKSL